MTQFQKKPSRIDALQFTGGGESALPIAEGLMAYDLTVRWVPAHVEYFVDNGAVVENALPEVLRFHDTQGHEGVIPVGSWVFANSFHDIVVLTNEEFTALYEEVNP